MKNHRILIVDDDEFARELLVTVLSDEYELDTTWNGEEAIKMAQENHYDVILMDKQMPIMFGDVSAMKIKEFKPEIPIISISAFEFNPKEKMFDDYLQKPFNWDVLRDKIKKKS
jgi:CheY-like chemotaxis protein